MLLVFFVVPRSIFDPSKIQIYSGDIVDYVDELGVSIQLPIHWRIKVTAIKGTLEKKFLLFFYYNIERSCIIILNEY